MKRMGNLTLCIAIMMTISVVVASSASAALPEFKSTKFPVSFTGQSTLPLEPALFSSILETKLNCAMAKTSGEVESATTFGKISILYNGCKEGTSGNTCTSTGEPAGAIITKTLSGRIGYIPGTLTTTKKVGTELEPTTGTVFAEFTCGGAAGKITIEGCTIGEAKPINVSQKTSSLLFEENASKNGQLLTEIDGGTHKPCEQTVTATVLKIKGKGWTMDDEEETYGENIELKA